MSEEERIESIELYIKSINEISRDLYDCENKELVKEGIGLIEDKTLSALNIIRKLSESKNGNRR